ncbi:unnamed protein product, partial [Cuscuta epithymum]
MGPTVPHSLPQDSMRHSIISPQCLTCLMRLCQVKIRTGDCLRKCCVELGRDVLNVIACEGMERAETREARDIQAMACPRDPSQMAGLPQLPLDQEIFNCVREKVK